MSSMRWLIRDASEAATVRNEAFGGVCVVQRVDAGLVRGSIKEVRRLVEKCTNKGGGPSAAQFTPTQRVLVCAVALALWRRGACRGTKSTCRFTVSQCSCYHDVKVCKRRGTNRIYVDVHDVPSSRVNLPFRSAALNLGIDCLDHHYTSGHDPCQVWLVGGRAEKMADGVNGAMAAVFPASLLASALQLLSDSLLILSTSYPSQP